MDKSLLLLLLLAVFPFVFFQGVGPATLCMVCNNFKRGHCLRGKGNCTMEQGPGCRTRDFFIFTERDGWRYNHTELDCSDHCLPVSFHLGAMKISTFCCKGRDFCNRYQGKGQEWKPR
uniref:Secreted seminal-vesicle Ly-6 protein 1-like n=1 Tax=Callorhinus ursinus TaxID=34884 RepID=A0A3Q7NTK3_CALUR|nr:secreted seminal-vesicle Ly-6 protein 1-like [Callorhinus ursinus]